MLFSVSFNLARSCSRSSLRGVGVSEAGGVGKVEPKDSKLLPVNFELLALKFFLLLRHPVDDLDFY